MEEKKEHNEEEPVDNSDGWWNSWITSAKSTSNRVIDLLKNDFAEISSSVKTETTSLLNSTASVIADGIQPVNSALTHYTDWSAATNSVKDSVSSIISQVNNALNPQPDDEDVETCIVENDKVVKMTKLQGKIILLSADANTYLKEIEDGMMSRFNAWLDSLKNYEINQLSNESLTKLLLSNPALKEKYELLVPSQVTHGEFWNRFLFRKALLEDEEAERERKKLREARMVEKIKISDESFVSQIPISETELESILSAYEKELKIAESKSELVEEKPTTSSKKEPGTSSPQDLSTVDKVSVASSDDWEKDFDIAEVS